MLAVDGGFKSLGNVMTWHDSRAAEESEYAKKELGEERLYRKSGWALAPSFDLPKILWLKNREPEVFSRAASFVSTIEYMNYFFTGKNIIDPINSAIRCLLNIETVVGTQKFWIFSA